LLVGLLHRELAVAVGIRRGGADGGED
jgi:hypothetical protein